MHGPTGNHEMEEHVARAKQISDDICKKAVTDTIGTGALIHALLCCAQ